MKENEKVEVIVEKVPEKVSPGAHLNGEKTETYDLMVEIYGEERAQRNGRKSSVVVVSFTLKTLTSTVSKNKSSLQFLDLKVENRPGQN